MYYFKFGENLKKLRVSHGLTQKELGDKVGLSKAVVSKYENGLGYPTFEVLIRLASYFNVTTDYLLGVDGAKTIDISGLTDEQTEVLHRLIQIFRDSNKK